MTLGILIAQTRGTDVPAGYLEGLAALGCLGRVVEWGPELQFTLTHWIPDVILLQHKGGDGGWQPYLDAITQHPATAHAAVGLVAHEDALRWPDGGASLILLNEDEFADYLRMFARLRQWMIEHSPLLFDDPLVFGDIALDRQNHSVQVDAQSVNLSGKEFALLAYLARRPGRTFNRHQLVSALWADVHDPDQRTVDVLVMRVRKTLAQIGTENIIQTVYKKGYRFVPPTALRSHARDIEPIAHRRSFGGASPWSLSSTNTA